MRSDWTVVLNILYIFILMFIAKLMKEKLGIFRSIIIPTSLLAGMLGLVLGPEVLGVLKFDLKFYESMVFHFMGIGFAALTLAEKETKQRPNSFNSGLFILSTYCFQAILGMIVILGLIFIFKQEWFIGLGLILPLAFGQGPGFASTIGGSWDTVLPYGFINQYGLTLATVGFLVGGVLGIILLNYYNRKYNIRNYKLRHLKGIQNRDLNLVAINEINFFDILTVQIVWLAVIYILCYVVMYFLNTALTNLGDIGATLAGLVRGFNFLFAIIIGMILKKIFEVLKRKGHRTQEMLDGYLMNNLASFSFNVMITSSVMAISINAIKDYWQLLVAISIIGAIGTLLYITYMGKKSFFDNHKLYTLAMFGMLTGTASTGLALLRGLDPDLKTDVAKDIVLGSAIAAPLGIPLMLLLGQPIIGYKTGNPIYYYITFFGILIYFLAIVFVMTRKVKKNKG